MSLLLSLLLAANPALSPVGPWRVKADGNGCLLNAPYRDGEKDLSLVFKPLVGLPENELSVIASDPTPRQYAGSYKLSVEPDGSSHTGRFFSIMSADAKLRITRLTVSGPFLENLDDAQVVRIKAFPTDSRLQLNGINQGKELLTDCIVKLKASWGIQENSNITTEPKVIPASLRYFSSDHYPAEAVALGVYGRVVALLNIDSAGTVKGCHIVSSAGPSLNAGTCRSALKMTFEPARERDGKPASSHYYLPVRWVMPGTGR